MRGALAMIGRTLLVLGFAMPLAAPAQMASCLDARTGEWSGRGRVAGREIVMRQVWRISIGGAFRELLMTHHPVTDSTATAFEGRGFYRSGARDSVHGTWMDARGFTMSLAGTCHEGALVMRWTGVESGETTYALQRDGTLLVIDRVGAPGAMREFGRSALRRVLTP
jgi:hypothetical protein